MLTTIQLADLASVRGEHLVSIFLPTNPGSRDTRENPIRLKNLCDEAERRLVDRGRRRPDAEASIKPARALLNDPHLWRHPGRGLAVFVEPGNARTVRVNTPLDEHVFVGDRFSVRPLVGAIDGPTSFFVLALHQGRVRLLRCDAESAREVDLHDIPASLTEVVGYDWEQESLQFHTRAQAASSHPGSAAETGAGQRTGVDRAAMFHSQGRGGDLDIKKREIEQFVKEAADGLSTLLGDRKEPVVLVAAEPVTSMFRNAWNDGRLLDQGVDGNTEHLSTQKLHELALPVVRPRFERSRAAAVAAYTEVKHTDRAVEGVHDVLAALNAGRVATLLVDPRRPVWGSPASPNAQDTQRGDDLLDLAVHQAISTGAAIHPMRQGITPVSEPVAAILRY